MKQNRPVNVPVILLAFANDRTQGTESRRFLDELANERIRFREILQELEQKGLWQVEVLPDVKADDIRKRFLSPVFRDRIAIFHFSGHADSGRHCLLLESGDGNLDAVPGELLANFLGRQSSLNLVVLSGCNTQVLGNNLLKAGVGAVLSTTDPHLDDTKASRFAESFYLALAGHRTVEQAYQDACSAVALVDERGVSRGIGIDEETEEVDGPAKPVWTLQFRPGAEYLRDWRLLEADPLQGLPLPNDIYLPAEPYQLNLLQSYRRQDALVFFGRGQIIRKLYDKLTSSHTYPIVLLCGQSGVGKSSLLAAGLLPRMEASHTVVLLRRPQRDQLIPELIQLLGGGENLATAWGDRETREHKPVLLVIDQLEELLAEGSGGQSEWLALLNALQPLFAAPDHWPQGKLLLGFRKEWLAEVDHGLSASRLPVGYRELLDRLERDGIVEAIEGIAKNPVTQDRWQLTLDPADGPERLAIRIAGDLLADAESPIAPTLQILLSRMWHAATQKNLGQPQFDTELYQNISRQGLHLADFLANELTLLEQQFPEASKSGLALDLLYEHTTDLGRAGEKSQTELQQLYSHCWPELNKLLDYCKSRFLLADCGTNEPATRLAHDTLAPLVRREFERSGRPGQVARHLLEERATRPNLKLLPTELRLIEKGCKGMRVWSSAEQNLVDRSRKSRRLNKAQKALLAGLALISMIAGLWYWDSEYREIVEYYAHFEKRWGLATGIAKLKREDVIHRNLSYELIRYGRANPVKEVRLRNGRGFCPISTTDERWEGRTHRQQEPSQRICRHVFEWSKEKKIIKEIVYDFLGDQKEELQYSANNIAHSTKGGYDSEFTFKGSHIKFKYNSQGYEIEQYFSNNYGSPIKNIFGCNGLRREYTSQGLIAAETCLNSNGEPIRHSYLFKSTFSKTVFEYDSMGNQVRAQTFDETGRLVNNRTGYATINASYDNYGNISEEYFFDSNTELADTSWGMSVIRFKVDEFGSPVEESYFNGEGAMVILDDGYAKVVYGYDKFGNSIEEDYYNQYNLLGKSKLGHTRLSRIYDADGRLTEEAYYDKDWSAMEIENNISIAGKIKFARFTENFIAKDKIIEKTYFNANGFRILLNRFNNHMRKIGESYFDEKGKPVINSLGFAKVTNIYDDQGNMVEEAYFNEQDRPINIAAGYARINGRYDDKKHLIEQAYFGEDGEPILNKTGFAKIVINYDKTGYKMEEVYFNEQGKSSPNFDGYAKLKYRYDYLGNVIEKAYFDEKDQSVRNKDGYAKVSARYGAASRAIEINYYDEHDHLTYVRNEGYARVIFDDDPKSNKHCLFDEKNRHIKITKYVKETIPGGQAIQAGIQVGDSLEMYNGIKIRDGEHFVELVSEAGTGLRSLKVNRNGRFLDFQVPPGKIGVILPQEATDEACSIPSKSII